MRRSNLALAVLGVVLWSGCQAPPKQANSPEVSAETRIEAIPDPDSSKYEKGQYSKTWENPYLIVRKDAIVLVDLKNSEEHMLKPDEVLVALAKLPASAWPYGRVVAVEETMKGTDQERVDIRRNRAIVAGTLESAHVLIHWVPAQ
jgi:hypothetical protein